MDNPARKTLCTRAEEHLFQNLYQLVNHLSDFAEMGALYGGLSALMTVVIWMFLMATIFLLSAQAVRVMHKRAVRNVYDFEERESDR